MTKNSGKIFEDAIKASIPEHCLLIRLPDPPQSFGRSEHLRFSRPNPCDYICHNSEDGKLWCLELKTTSGKSISFENIYSDKKESRMIHKHQTLGLLEFSKHNRVVSGFLFNFRLSEGTPEYDEHTYFMEVNDFQKMCDSIGKKSFNEKDIMLYTAIPLAGIKKKVRFVWDIDTLFKEYDIDGK